MFQTDDGMVTVEFGDLCKEGMPLPSSIEVSFSPILPYTADVYCSKYSVSEEAKGFNHQSC